MPKLKIIFMKTLLVAIFLSFAWFNRGGNKANFITAENSNMAHPELNLALRDQEWSYSQGQIILFNCAVQKMSWMMKTLLCPWISTEDRDLGGRSVSCCSGQNWVLSDLLLLHVVYYSGTSRLERIRFNGNLIFFCLLNVY